MSQLFLQKSNMMNEVVCRRYDEAVKGLCLSRMSLSSQKKLIVTMRTSGLETILKKFRVQEDFNLLFFSPKRFMLLPLTTSSSHVFCPYLLTLLSYTTFF